jgi:hypothetical protein
MTGPAATPDGDDDWSRDARQLLAEYGDTWEIAKSADNPLILVAERTIGTETRVVAGRPGDVLRRIRALPAAPGAAPAGTIVRQDVGGWLSGSCT